MDTGKARLDAGTLGRWDAARGLCGKGCGGAQKGRSSARRAQEDDTSQPTTSAERSRRASAEPGRATRVAPHPPVPFAIPDAHDVKGRTASTSGLVTGQCCQRRVPRQTPSPHISTHLRLNLAFALLARTACQVQRKSRGAGQLVVPKGVRMRGARGAEAKNGRGRLRGTWTASWPCLCLRSLPRPLRLLLRLTTEIGACVSPAPRSPSRPAPQRAPPHAQLATRPPGPSCGLLMHT